jgi:hypothetical protein
MPIIQATRRQKLRFEASSGSNLARLSQQQKKVVVVAHACLPSYSGSRSRRIMVQNDPGRNVKFCLKNNQSKKD